MHPPHFDESFIPHQLHLDNAKIKKILKGLPVIIPHHTMGSGVGHHVIMLKPQNARKLLTSYKKNKGMKMHLSPDELHHSIHHGRGLFDVAKKLYRVGKQTVKSALRNPVINEMAADGVHYGADAVGTAVGTFFGNPVAGLAVGELLGRTGRHLIEQQKVDTGTKGDTVSGTLKGKAKEIAFDAIHNQIDEQLPKEYRAIAKQALQGSFDIDKGKQELKEGAKNYLMNQVKQAYVPSAGMGLYGGGRLKKGSPEAKAFMASIRKKKSGGKVNMDPLGVGKKIKEAGRKIKETFTPELGNRIVDDLKLAGHYALPATTGAIGSAMGTFVGGPIGGVAGSAMGSYAGKEINKAIGNGVRRGRGRPRKKGLGLATESMVFKQALRNNFNGLTLSDYQINNEPVSNFKINPNVKASSNEMTLSPYQGIHSPAMNPFVPTNYEQMGGTSSGYGGAGVNRFGHNRHMKSPYKGVGLYGGGIQEDARARMEREIANAHAQATKMYGQYNRGRGL